MIDVRVKRLVDLVVLRDEYDCAFDDMSTQQMGSCMKDYREVEREMVQLARELDTEFENGVLE